MRFGSVCSGIEAASVAWHPLGWQCAFVSEIDAFPCAVLAHHYPDVPNLGDMTKFQEWPDAAIDVLVGGTPCQSFSVAGLRKGLDDPRGNLMLTYLAIADRYRPEWLVWENVPGVLSSNRGRYFGTFLGALGELGYGFAYRVLDAQFFRLAQRRRRVFVVGCLGGWRRAAAVLFERASLRGDPAPRREAGQRAAGTLTRSALDGSGACGGDGPDGFLVPDRAGTLTSAGGHAYPGQTVQDHPLARGAHPPAIAFDPQGGGKQSNLSASQHRVGALGTTKVPAVAGMQVRRLTPRECERLQGFPDDYTLIPYRGKPAADGPRYKALGNSMAVPVMRWLGERIAMVNAIPLDLAA